MTEHLWDYLRRGKKGVSGWLQRVDAEIMGVILELQAAERIGGSCVEIGVHHGKSFIPLCLSLREGERALCIDIFENQAANLDASGEGDLAAFESNLKKFGIDPRSVVIRKGSSAEVRPEDILEQVGPARYFSVDGGHWRSIVESDLSLAERTICEGGVIALDDFFRVEWPDVSYGYMSWQERSRSDIVPFAAGSNKLFLCRARHAPRYREALRKQPFLAHYLSKSYRVATGEIDCYRLEPYRQDEEDARGMLRFMLKMFRPGLYVALRNRLGTAR